MQCPPEVASWGGVAGGWLVAGWLGGWAAGGWRLAAGMHGWVARGRTMCDLHLRTSMLVGLLVGPAAAYTSTAIVQLYYRTCTRYLLVHVLHA